MSVLTEDVLAQDDPAEDWTHDPARAAAEPRPMPRPIHTAPQWMRCEWFSGVVRCRLAAGHIGVHKAGPPGACSEETGRFAVVPDVAP